MIKLGRLKYLLQLLEGREYKLNCQNQFTCTNSAARWLRAPYDSR